MNWQIKKSTIIHYLLSGGYLRAWKQPSGRGCYRLYDPINNPVMNVSTALIKSFERNLNPGQSILKSDHAGRMTLNLKTVRGMHGRTVLKKMYKKSKQPK